MKNVAFLIPYFLETSLRFLDGALRLPDVRLALISQDSIERLPEKLRAGLAGHYRIRDGLDPRRIQAAVVDLSKRLGPVTRLVGVLEQLQVPLAQVRRNQGIEGLSVEAARNFRDKSRMKTLFEQAGLPCARHRLVDNRQDAVEFLRDVGFPAVVKPNAGAGAKQTFRLNSQEQLEDYLSNFPPERGGALFEEFITGKEHSFDCVSIDGKPVWHSISRYFPTPLDVMENPWIQWCVLLPRRVDGPEFADIRKTAFRALEVLGAGTSLTHLEWFRRPDGSLAISEVAARPPGAQFTTLMSYAHDLDFYRAWPRLMIENRFDVPERRYAVGVAFLRGQGTGRIKAIHGLDQAQKEVGDLVIESRLPRLGQAPSETYEGDGYAIVRHPETEVVKQALARTVETIRVELA